MYIRSIQRGAVVLSAALLCACATTQQTSQIYAGAWVGKSLDNFVIKHGAPQVRETLSDGRLMVEWRDFYGIGRGGALADTVISSAGGADTQGGSYQLTCAVRMIVDKSSTIREFSIVKDTIGAWRLSRCEEVLP